MHAVQWVRCKLILQEDGHEARRGIPPPIIGRLYEYYRHILKRAPGSSSSSELWCTAARARGGL